MSRRFRVAMLCGCISILLATRQREARAGSIPAALLTSSLSVAAANGFGIVGILGTRLGFLPVAGFFVAPGIGAFAGSMLGAGLSPSITARAGLAVGGVSAGVATVSFMVGSKIVLGKVGESRKNMDDPLCASNRLPNDVCHQKQQREESRTFWITYGLSNAALFAGTYLAARKVRP